MPFHPCRHVHTAPALRRWRHVRNAADINIQCTDVGFETIARAMVQTFGALAAVNMPEKFWKVSKAMSASRGVPVPSTARETGGSVRHMKIDCVVATPIGTFYPAMT